MSMHYWGDSFDWEGLNDSIEIIHHICTKYGRIGIHIKEKWGQIDCYTYLWDGSLHGLIYPGYAWNQFPKWLWNIDCDYITPTIRFFKIQKILHFYQKAIYRYAYDKALTKHPNIKEEIIGGIAEYDILEKVMKKHGLKNPWVTYQQKTDTNIGQEE